MFHKEIQRDPKNQRVEFENHIEYADMKVGDMFGMRTLLDTGNCQKYLQHNLIRFSE